MKKLVLGLAIASAMVPMNAVAKGTATVDFTSTDKVTVGETFKVYMNIKDINDTYDGVESFGGRLKFDADKIEYESAKNMETPYQFYINPNHYYTIAGLDFTLDNGIRENTAIYEFTFRAKTPGITSITLNEAALTDSKSYIDSTVMAKNIEIVEPIEVEPIMETQDKDEEVKPVTKVVSINNTEETHKAKIVKLNNYVHNFIKSISKLF